MIPDHLQYLKEQLLAGKQLSWDRELSERLKPKISILSRKHTVLFPARVIGGSEDGVVYCADGSAWRIKKKHGGKWTRRRVKR